MNNKTEENTKNFEYQIKQNPKDFDHSNKIQIKKIPEDFIVKEIPNNIFKKDNGKYLIYKLRKTKRNTEDCIQYLSKKLNVPRKYFGYAGTKDRNAITEQYISAYNIKNMKSKIQNIKETFENFTLEFVGYLDNPLSLGDHAGNKFETTIRNIDKKIEINNPKFIVDYFDDQRFSKNNHIIGKAIVKKDFKKAVSELKKQNNLNKELIETYKEDYIRILRFVPKKILNMFVHAYQSYLFNEICKRIIIEDKIKYSKADYSLGKLFFIKKVPKNYTLPLIGYGTEIEEKNSLIFSLLKEEDITTRDFIIKQVPELSSFGSERDFVTKVIDFSHSNFQDDELNQGKKKVTLRFELGKGSYATIVIKKVMSLSEDK